MIQAMCWGYISKQPLPSQSLRSGRGKEQVIISLSSIAEMEGITGLLLLSYGDNYDTLTGFVQLSRNIYLSTQYVPGTMLGAGKR